MSARRGGDLGAWLKANGPATHREMSLFQKAVFIVSQFAGLVEATGPGGLTSGGESDAGPSVTVSNVMGLSAAWACLNLLAGIVGSLPGMIYQGEGEERQVRRDHWLYRILHDSPNAEMTALDFWEYVAGALELRGNFYARKLMIGDRMVGLQPYNPDQVQPYRVNQYGAIRYRVNAGRERLDLSAEEMFHIRGFGGDMLRGISTLAVGRQVFGLALAGDQVASGLFRNGMRPVGAVVFEDEFKGDQRDRAESIMADKYAGAVNSGKPLVFDRGQKWQSIQLSPDDAQMLETRKFGIEEVCRMFLVPPVMIGHTEKVTAWGTGLEQIKLGFLQFSLQRRLERIEQAVLKQLMTPADRAAGVKFEFNVEGFLRADSRGRSAYYSAGLKDGWMTINEVRRKENLPPIPGGDIPRIQAQNVPVSDAAAAPVAAPAGG